MSYEIFSVCNYATSNNEFIKNKKIIYNSINELTNEILITPTEKKNETNFL